MAIIGNPTPGNDVITGDERDNRIDALAGNDTVDGKGGDDVLLGNVGNDTLTGGLGTDSLDGGAGFDRVVETGDFNFTLSNDKLIAGTLLNKLVETDTLVSIERATLTGGASANTINAAQFTGDVLLNGLAGNDTLTGGSGRDTLDGGLGDDILSGGNLDVLIGGEGNDKFLGGPGVRVQEVGDVNFTLTDTTLTGNGTDSLSGIKSATLSGGVSSNTLNASSFTGVVRLNGNSGNDVLTGGTQGDLLEGDSGADTLSGNGGNDELLGDLGDDFLQGGIGQDTLFGGDGNDVLNGGDGDDHLRGERGNDALNGGTGLDSTFESIDANLTLSNTKLEIKNASLTETDTLSSIEKASLFGGASDNIIAASGFSGQVELFGSGGNDTLTGGSNSDFLAGGDGRDSLNGFNDAAFTLEKDVLNGGAGNDTFILGFNISGLKRVGYSDFGSSDFATLTDFNATEVDKIRVGGSLSEYTLDKTQSVSGIGSNAIDTRIFRNNELIAIVQDNTNVLINRDFLI